MRWNCPHCGVSLGVSDDKFGSGWSFSRCYKCGGFALIRKAEVNLIKVDKAPVGENVLLPEAAETPVLSQQATQTLERLLNEKPSIRPAKPRTNDPNEPSANSNGNNNNNIDNNNATPAAAKSKIPPNPYSILPDPLPEAPEKPAYFRMLPAAIGFAGVLAVSSGVYLYMQGQALWKSARAKAANDAIAVTSKNQQNIVIANREPENTANTPTSTVVMDRVQHNMMSPARSTESNQVPLAVRIRLENSKLRSGPGVNYPIVGIADNQVQYEVLEWKGDWFKVAPIKAARAVSNANEYEISAWIRNDLVEHVNRQSN